MAKAHHGGHHGGDSVTDVALHQRTFEAFIRFFVYLFSVAIGILIFLALFNS